MQSRMESIIRGLSVIGHEPRLVIGLIGDGSADLDAGTLFVDVMKALSCEDVSKG